MSNTSQSSNPSRGFLSNFIHMISPCKKFDLFRLIYVYTELMLEVFYPIMTSDNHVFGLYHI